MAQRRRRGTFHGGAVWVEFNEPASDTEIPVSKYSVAHSHLRSQTWSERVPRGFSNPSNQLIIELLSKRVSVCRRIVIAARENWNLK